MQKALCCVIILIASSCAYANQWLLEGPYIARDTLIFDCPLSVTDVSFNESCEWPQGIVITVINNSSKPIYFISGMVLFPASFDTLGCCEDDVSLNLEWGNERFRNYTAGFTESDDCLLPGNIAVLTVKGFHDNLSWLRKAGAYASIEIHFLNNGDGTGWSIMTRGAYDGRYNHRC